MYWEENWREVTRAWQPSRWLSCPTNVLSVQRSIPRAHMVEAENRLPEVVLWPPHGCRGICVHIHLCAHAHTTTTIARVVISETKSYFQKEMSELTLSCRKKKKKEGLGDSAENRVSQKKKKKHISILDLQMLCTAKENSCRWWKHYLE